MIWNILEGARSLMGTDYPEKALVIRPGALVTSLVLNVLCSVAQLCPTLCNPMDCSLPGSSVHGILQTRVLEWVAMLSSRGPEDHISYVSCISRCVLYHWCHLGSPGYRWSKLISHYRISRFPELSDLL